MQCGCVIRYGVLRAGGALRYKLGAAGAFSKGFGSGAHNVQKSTSSICAERSESFIAARHCRGLLKNLPVSVGTRNMPIVALVLFEGTKTHCELQ